MILRSVPGSAITYNPDFYLRVIKKRQGILIKAWRPREQVENHGNAFTQVIGKFSYVKQWDFFRF
jgi:hypothetical protein